MTDLVTATADPRLRARVLRRVPLHYTEGADEGLDRPAHVRAGSSLAAVPGGIALVQDDANFIAVVAGAGAHVRAIALPAGPEGERQFDDGRGNKAHKLDLEACVAAEHDDDTLLVALGSGSSARRERVALVTGWRGDHPSVRVVHVPRLYAALRDESAFAGSELNVEGAIRVGDRLRLFGRGNGAARDDAQPVNATCDLAWDALLAHLHAPEDPAHDAPRPEAIRRYALGVLDGIALGFTDAAPWRDRILFSAAAEDSPDAVRDGRVTGSVIGVMDPSGAVRWTPLTDANGAPLAVKVEGLLPDPDDDRRLYVVVDADDPDAASELVEVELEGGWGDE